MNENYWHYVYYSYEEGGRGYIGKRSSKLPPEEDPYLGSFTDKTFKPSRKIIIATFDSSENAIRAEIALHRLFKVDKEPHFANKAIQPSPHFCRFLRRPSKARICRLSKKRKPFTSPLSSIETDYVWPQEEIDYWLDQFKMIQKENEWLIREGRGHELINLCLLKTPAGMPMAITNLPNFCERFNLNAKKLALVMAGGLENWQGWTRL
jgi:hypothetical protein